MSHLLTASERLTFDRLVANRLQKLCWLTVNGDTLRLNEMRDLQTLQMSRFTLSQRLTLRSIVKARYAELQEQARGGDVLPAIEMRDLDGILRLVSPALSSTADSSASRFKP